VISLRLAHGWKLARPVEAPREAMEEFVRPAVRAVPRAMAARLKSCRISFPAELEGGRAASRWRESEGALEIAVAAEAVEGPDLAMEVLRAMGQALSGTLFPKPEQASLRDTFVERWAENDPRAYIEATLSVVGWNVTDKISSIQCPTLVISADQDYTPLALKEAYVRLMPHAQLAVIADAHHATPVEKPEEFNAVLAQFLAGHP